MIIRSYSPADCEEVLRLFYNTVHIVNARDYSEEQLCVWASGGEDMEEWNRSLLEHYTLLAQEQGQIVGFGDISSGRYLDRLFVHHDFQRQGIAGALCQRLEEWAGGNVTTHASITALPFFLKRGYIILREQKAERQGVSLVNYLMEKIQDKPAHMAEAPQAGS